MSLLRFARLAAKAAVRGPEEVPAFSAEELRTAELGRGLPPGFLLGAATAAHQVEGGNENDWTDWERGTYPDGRPHIHGGDVSGLACDSWNRFDEDLRCLQELGANAYRLSVEWSRLEPEEGKWNAEAAARYRGWLERLRAAGIQSMVTLYHFTLPRWVAREGGWESDRTVERLVAFTRRCADAFGDLPGLWCTLNEPNVTVVQGYVRGIWPPGKHDQKLAAAGMARQLRAHARMAELLRPTKRPVGLAHHVRVFRPARRSVLDRVLTAATDDFMNEAIVDALRTGRIEISIPGSVNIDERVPGLAGSCDYLGLNYYSRDHVQADLKDPSLSKQFVPEDRPKTDLGWEVYPEGLYLLLKRWSRLGLPLYVTENGLADRTGQRRAEFLRQHFHALQRAAADGVDVRGYFHWSLMDNFEWAEGYSAPFGLYAVDFNDPQRRRTPTSGVAEFQRIARNLRAPTGATAPGTRASAV